MTNTATRARLNRPVAFARGAFVLSAGCLVDYLGPSPLNGPCAVQVAAGGRVATVDADAVTVLPPEVTR